MDRFGMPETRRDLELCAVSSGLDGYRQWIGCMDDVSGRKPKQIDGIPLGRNGSWPVRARCHREKNNNMILVVSHLQHGAQDGRSGTMF